jgi:hypothetical protein
MEAELKRRVYLVCWLVLGALLGTLIGELLEYFTVVQAHNEVMENRTIIYLSLVFGGILLGYILGPKAWKKIYVEGIRGKKYVVKAKGK